MDFTILTEYFEIVILVACLVVGYNIKHATLFKWIPNGDIPLILTVFGAILNPVVSGLSVDNVVFGALTGLASTGFHQAFTCFIEGRKNNSGVNSDE